MMHNGLKQSDNLIIRSSNLSDNYMARQIQGYVQEGLAVSNVWLFDGKEIEAHQARHYLQILRRLRSSG